MGLDEGLGFQDANLYLLKFSQYCGDLLKGRKLNAKLIRYVVIGTLCAAPLLGFAAGEPLIFCVDDQNRPPTTFPTKDGTHQVLMRMAAAEAGFTITFRPLNFGRCREELAKGTVQGATDMAYVPANIALVAFPTKKGGGEDATRSMQSGVAGVFRLKGSKSEWDGTAFKNVTQPILAPQGVAIVAGKLKSLNVQFNDENKLFGRNIAKMLAGQGELVIAFEDETIKKSLAGEYAGKIEMLPKPFVTANFYATVLKSHYEKNTEQIEKFWNAIGKLQTSPAYLDAIKNIQ